jgi:hypothetical protein
MLTIVIARYNESIEWIKNLNELTTTLAIYNKGPSLNSLSITLPNVGREGHTYLYHIIHNYDTLSEYTMFLQGNPFDHTPYLYDIIQSNEWKKPFHIISKLIYHVNIAYDPNDINLQMIPYFNMIFNRNKSNHPFYFGAGAQFCVSRETIRSRPVHFYQKIYEMLNKDINPIEGFILERFWPMIFLGESLEERTE